MKFLRALWPGGVWTHLCVIVVTFAVGAGSPAFQPAFGQQGVQASLLFNEIMYHPASTNLLEDFVEFYNSATTNVDLTNWKLKMGGGPASFTFPSNTTITAKGYLVVAADRRTFTNKYPAVANFVAGWTGRLSRDGETIQLEDAAGETVNEISFAPEGDWAFRRLGAADQYGKVGWEWFAEHDGYGKTLELINPGLPNTYGQNWGSSSGNNGTPGQANSIARTNIAPLIAEVAHFPIIPKSTDPITITARIIDERGAGPPAGLTVTLLWHVDGTATTNNASMFDDGAHGDGLANDGIYGANLSAMPDGTILEFSLQARDLENNLRIFPNVQTNSVRTANLVFQVDNLVYAGVQPIYRIIMASPEYNYLSSQVWNGSVDSDAEVSGTFISTDGIVDDGVTTKLRYSTSFRNRGHGSRSANPHNIRVSFPKDRPWKKRTALNLNTQNTQAQLLGSALFRRLGMPMPDSRPVQVRVNAANLAGSGSSQFGSYAANDEVDGDFVEAQFPLDDQGNLYRGIRDVPPGASADFNSADLACSTPSSCYTNEYYKQNNTIEWDFSDIVQLIQVMNPSTPLQLANYTNAMRGVANVDEWMKFMAANTLLDNQETTLVSGYGDDYALYRGTNDTRCVLLPYDMDSIMGAGTRTVTYGDGLFRMNTIPAIERFMTNQVFLPIYYRQLRDLIQGAFAPENMDVLLDQLRGQYDGNTELDTAMANMKAFNRSHINYVLGQMPLTLSVSSGLVISNGYPRTTSSSVALSGFSSVVDTRSVLVNSNAVSWNPRGGAWSGNVTLRPGINLVLVQALNDVNEEFERTTIDIWYDDSTVANVSGTLGSSTTWTAAGGPYNVTANLTVPAGVTLTIQPGTTVYVASGATITVNSTGKILAQGTETQRIRIGKNPAVGQGSALWGSLDFVGTTVESRLAYIDFDSCGGTTLGSHNAQLHVNNSIVFIDHCTWSSTPVVEYISFDASSFIVQNCVFPSYPPPTGPESLHGVNGIPNGGYGIFRDNYFGHTWGFNDTIDFTGGNRPGPILQIINNVFDGASDDHLDLDSTDAWIEGNIFMHAHRDPTRSDNALDTSSAISGGVDTVGQNPDWTIINNIFYDVDHVFLNKGNSTTTPNGGGRVAFLYNTVIHVAKEYSGSTAGEIAAFNWSDDDIVAPDPAVGSGMYAAYNIIYDCATLHHLYNPANHTVIMENNILSVPWSGPGTNNRVIDPLLNLGALSGTAPTNVTVSQLREAAKLLSGSPALSNGFGGLNLGGGFQPNGIVITGEPTGTNASTSATLTLGPGGTFNWGTNAPQRWGWTAYKWKLDGGAYSAEIAVTNNSPFTNPPTITVSGLANGTHTVYVVGKNDAGYYQDDTFVYPASAGIPARVTASKTWTVNTGYVPPTPKPSVRLNEILASNSSALTNGGTTPDAIELYNFGSSPVDLTGMGVSDNVDLPYKFTFPATTTLAGGTYLVLYCDSAFAAPGLHTGFSLKASGDDVYLFDKPGNGGALLDSIVFGIQLTDRSIGRRTDGTWGLCKPTFGQAGPAPNANIALSLGLYSTLKINEWLADAQFANNNDFIELYNPDPLPVALGGLFLSDAAGALNRNQIPDLSFIAGNGLTSFIADSDPGQGADHLNFHLSPDSGVILLSAPDLSLIDAIAYGSQQTDVSQGRSPNGSDLLTTFAQPTEGSANPAPRGGITYVTNITSVSVPLINITNTNWKWDNSGVDQGTVWRNTNFLDNVWSNGFGLFGSETPGVYPYPIQTSIPAPNQTGGHWTVYYRTHFQWTNTMTNFILMATNYVDDGALYYLNGAYVGGLRLTFPATYTTPAGNQLSEGAAEILTFSTNSLVRGDNVMAVEVHQSTCCGAGTSSDDVFGMALSAVQSVTNIITNVVGFTAVVLNEVLANNQALTNISGHTADWIELYNPSNAVDLSDCSLSDDPNEPRKWVFPTNSTIGLRGYLVIYCDPDLPISRTNTGFGLNASGEILYLFDRPGYGGGLLDAVRFGLQTPDFAIGRIPSGTGNWTLTVPSLGSGNAAASLGSISLLRVNEWMANPSSGDDWFEICNLGTAPAALGGLFLTDDLTDRTKSPIPPLSFIGSGGNGFIQFIADDKVDNGADHVSFKLNNGGEQIGIYSPSGTLLNGYTFGSQIKGVSQGRFPDGSATIVNFSTTISPGEANYLPIPNVVINELLSHTDPPFEDALELYNPTLTGTNITGWFLSNSKLNLKKYRITNSITLGANGYTVFYENQFGNTNSATAFTFNSAHGDEAILSAADGAGNLTGYRVRQKFGAAENTVSFGRYQTSVGFDFTAMSQRTFGVDNPISVIQFRTGTGATNAYPKVGPIVINEIMYHPVSGTNLTEEPEEEFLEIRNITGASVQLFDPSYPTNTWKFGNGVEFQFPTNVTLAANAYLLVVGFNPSTDSGALASFRTKYGVSNTVPILGPWQGRLDNSGESVELYKPDAVQLPPHPDSGFVPYILVDRVNYQSVAPWSTNANGTGASLQRILSANYGNDPVNWAAGSPSAGRTNTFVTIDTDNDGMPDSWEIANNLNPFDPTDAQGDEDHDGLKNVDEYRAGTNPRDANSNLRIISQIYNRTNFVLQFNAIAGKSYSVGYRTNLALGGWTTVSNVPPAGANSTVTITDSTVASSAKGRFYRVTLPNP